MSFVIYAKNHTSGMLYDISIFGKNRNPILIDKNYVYKLLDSKPVAIDVRLFGSGDTFLFLEHIESAIANKKSRNIFIPNYEMLDETDFKNLEYITEIWCKTEHAMEISKKILHDRKLKIPVKFISMTSKVETGVITDADKISKKPDLFLHQAGSSPFKNTKIVVTTWLKYFSENKNIKLLITRKSFIENSEIIPDLEFLKKDSKLVDFRELMPESKTGNFKVYRFKNLYFCKYLPEPVYLETIKNSICLMPSEIEGFGHSINESSYYTVVLTSDFPPMNEIITDKRFLIPVTVVPYKPFFKNPASKYLKSAKIKPEIMKKYIDFAIKMSAEEFRKLVEKNRKQFLIREKNFYNKYK